MKSAREAAFNILLEMEKEGTYSNLAINKYLASNDVDSPGLLRKLVYGVTEKSLYLDYYLDRIMAKGVKGTKPNVLTLLRMGAYQLEYMDGVPTYAAISTTVDLARKHVKGMEKLVNGVLRNWQRRKDEIALPDKDKAPEEYLSISYSCHSSIVSLLMNQYGYEGCEALLKYFDSPKYTSVRVNCLKGTPEEIEEEFKSLDIKYKRSDLSPRIIHLMDIGDLNITDLKAFTEGRISIQSQESCWIADNAGAKPGYRVLDLCAAPGGKTQAMAEAMENTGHIDACDLYEHRLKLIEAGAKRLGLTNIKVHNVDATSSLNMDYSGEYDLVLADVPCSGLGVMGRKPEIKNREFKDEELISIQEAILGNAIHQVKPGGRVVYSTCTINENENGKVVSEIIKDRNDIRIIKEKQLVPHIDNSDGFYMAIIEKVCGMERSSS